MPTGSVIGRGAQCLLRHLGDDEGKLCQHKELAFLLRAGP
jgi:hypothetical protein